MPSVFIALAQNLNIAACKPRLPNSLGLFSKYDGNIIGGALLGFGLALTGACPGTVVPQVATGVASGPLVFAGGILGGALYSRFGKYFQRSIYTQVELENNTTLYESVGISRNAGIIGFIATCTAVVAASEYFFPGTTVLLIPAAAGGLLMGLTQLSSLLLTGATLGISSAYEQIGDVFWWFEKYIFESSSEKPSAPPQITDNMIFAFGTMLGSYAVSKMVDLPVSAPMDISTFRAVFGGAVMIFGSRLAGGCTSGHGISGMSQLSLSSIVSVAAMFAGGMGLAAIL